MRQCSWEPCGETRPYGIMCQLLLQPRMLLIAIVVGLLSCDTMACLQKKQLSVQ